MRSLLPLAALLVACGGSSTKQARDAGTVDLSASSPADLATIEPVDGGGSIPDALAFDTSLASLTAHNTSASATYDKAHFAANFGSTTVITQDGGTLPIDDTLSDRSMNPVTPGHVSSTNVHTLVPSRPDLRWFAHATPWFKSGGGNHIDIGLENDSTAYVAAMIADMKRRGFDGIILDWYGKGSYEDAVTLLVQKALDADPDEKFTFIVMLDKGITGLSESVLETQLAYVRTQYLSDEHYELEGGKPIVMFFGVYEALGATSMQTAKTNAGSGTVWVVQGTGALGQAWVDQVFDWTHDFHDGPSKTDPYNLAGVKGFYATMAKATKPAFGGMEAGFDGTLTNNYGWSLGKYLPRGDGACLVQTAATIDASIPANVTRMQWATWSDWEEGSEIESGVENGLTITASASGTTLSWSVGGGDTSTVDHFDVWASLDGTNGARLATLTAGATSFDVGALPAGTYSLYVDAVGKACIRDHLSAATTFTR